MKPLIDRKIEILIAAIALGFFPQPAFALEKLPGWGDFMVVSRQSHCSAPGVDDFEGTDMSGVTPKCNAIFNACIDKSAPCKIRIQKCAEFDKMDRNGSCYKSRRS